MADLNPTWWKTNSKVEASKQTDPALKTLYGEFERYLDVYSKAKAAYDKAKNDARAKQNASDALKPVKVTCGKFKASKAPQAVKDLAVKMGEKVAMDEKLYK
jgi:hypothetical protein